MQSVICVLVVLALGAPAPLAAAQDGPNPISKVIELLSELQAKLIKDGEVEEKAFRDYFEWCDDASKEKQFEIKTLKAQAEDLKATIQKETSDIEALSTKIEELAANLATNSADLKAAGEIREKEHSDFGANEADLMDTVDTLGRAIRILQQHVS